MELEIEEDGAELAENKTILRRSVDEFGNKTPFLELKLCDYCSNMPTNHFCRHKISNSGIFIEGECDEICGKASCAVCRSTWGDPEEFANRCRMHK